MRCLFRPEPAAFALSKFAAHASYNLTSFRDSANGRFRYSYFAPAPCSPPLGGSDGYSAVRFTAAVKYGGRENRLSRRETGYMSGHPRRAHHKLEWARKGQSGIKVLYEHLPRSESSKVIITQSRSYYLLRACKSRFPHPASIYGRVRAMWSRSYYLLRACKSRFPRSASIYGRARAMWSRSYYLLRACKSRFPHSASIYGRVRAMWSRSYHLLRGRKASSRHQLRYMVDGGPAARNQARIASEKHLPALNSCLWLSAGSAPNLE